jgi:hypothetical protein
VRHGLTRTLAAHSALLGPERRRPIRWWIGSITALLQGVRLGSVHQAAQLQKQGIQVHLHDHIIEPDDPLDEENDE